MLKYFLYKPPQKHTHESAELFWIWQTNSRFGRETMTKPGNSIDPPANAHPGPVSEGQAGPSADCAALWVVVAKMKTINTVTYVITTPLTIFSYMHF